MIVALLGIIRLGRQFPAAAASPALLVPFLLPVLALSLEAGALVALSTAQLRQLLRAVPVGSGPPATPRLTQVRATLPLLGMLALVLGAAQLIPRGTEHPGAFANELVQTARASCGAADAKVAVPVPLLGLSVSCGEPRRIQGPMPGVRSVQVAMSELTFSEDLRRVDIVGLELTAARALRVHLRAGRARIAGLAPWSRSPRLSPLGRFAILATLGAVLWLAAAFGFRSVTRVDEAMRPGDPLPSERDPPRQRWRSLLAMLLLMVPGAVVAAGFISLDQERAAPPAYAIAALLGLVGLGLVRLLSGRVPRIFSSFRGS